MSDPAISRCAGCGRTQAHTRGHIPSGTVRHEARGMCTACTSRPRRETGATA